MDFSGIGLRDVILVALALSAVYLLVAMLRLAQVNRRRHADAAPKKAAKKKEPKPAKEAREMLEPKPEEMTTFSQASEFGEQLFRSGVEAELQQLRGEVAALKEELKLMKAARRVSPQYNEAMMLAQRGRDAQDIAAQCGISVGEAELVLALSRNKQEYEDYGENPPF